MSKRKTLHLVANIGGVGSHEGAWRLDGAESHRLTDPTFFQAQAKTAEEARLDAVFLVDFLGFNESLRERAHPLLEPIAVMAGIAAVTDRLGVMATGSTTHNHPYDLARIFATLDHISGGRAGWNIVTSGSNTAARNFGGQEHSHADRYAHGAHFVDAVKALWDSWKDGASVADRRTGVYADKARINDIAFHGGDISIEGALNIPRPPQGHPVLMQAGSSDRGMTFAARYAEVVMTAQPTLRDAQNFYSEVKGRAVGLGRGRDDIKILPGIQLILGSTQAEAERLKQEADEQLIPAALLDWLVRHGIDLTGYDLDDPLPADLGEMKGFQGIQSRLPVIAGMVEKWGPMTVRQLTQRLAGGRGHITCVGTPEQAADVIEEWFLEGGADGFVPQFGIIPQSFDVFCEHVVPVLQHRGLFRYDYEGTTLRDHLGLSRPRDSAAARAA